MNVDTTYLTQFAQALRAQGKQKATIESYSRDAREFLSYLSFYSVRLKEASPEHFVHYQEHLRTVQQDHINSVRRKVIGIRQFFRFLEDQKIINTAPFDDMPIPSRQEGLPEILDPQDIDALIVTATKQDTSTSLKSSRDCLMICLLAYEGLKASELIELKWADVLWEETHATLRIPGIKHRVIGLSELTSAELRKYQESFKNYFAEQNKSPDHYKMIISFKGRDSNYSLPKISRHGLKFTLYELGEKAGLKGLNTELLRHFAITHLLEEGKSPDEIMNHLGLRRSGNIAKHASRLKKASLHADHTPAASIVHEGSSQVSV